MATIHRVRVVWTGIPSGNGVSTFYSEASTVPNLGALRAGLANLAAVLPTGVTLTIENQGDTISDADGILQGSWSTAAQSAVVGAAAGAYAAAVGGCVNWQTAGLHNSRRLRGRTFVVPLAASAFGGNGQLLAGAVTALQGLANGVTGATGAKFVVWGRPTVARNPDGTKIPGAVGSGGTSSAITAATVPSKGMVLTSRRD